MALYVQLLLIIWFPVATRSILETGARNGKEANGFIQS